VLPEEDENQSLWNFSVCSEPVNRKKRQDSMVSQGRKSFYHFIDRYKGKFHRFLDNQ